MRAVGVLVGLALLAPGRAHAQPLRLAPSPCPQVSTAVLSRLLAVELRGDGVAAIRDARPLDADGVAEVALESDCREPLSIRVRVTHPGRRVVEVREVDLDGVPRGLRIRLLALSTAELLRATWSEPAPAPEAAPAIARPAPPRSAPPPTHRLARPRPAAAEGAPPPREERATPPAASPRGELASPPASSNRASFIAHEEEPSLATIGAGASVRFFPAGGAVLATSVASLRVGIAARGFVAIELGAGASGAGLVAIPAAVRFGLSLEESFVRLDLGPRLEADLLIPTAPQSDNDRGSPFRGLVAATLAAELALRVAPEVRVSLLGDVGWTIAGPPGLEGLTTSVGVLARAP